MDLRQVSDQKYRRKAKGLVWFVRDQRLNNSQGHIEAGK